MSDWLKVQQGLAALWQDIERLAQASTQPLSEAERREIGLARLAKAGAPVDDMDPAQLEPLLESYLPHASETEAVEVNNRLGSRLQAWFQDPHPRVVPLVNPTTHEVEIVVAQGAQALYLMSVSLARNDLGAFPRRCARAKCTTKTFMKGRKIYCSQACQEADKSARYRRRRENQATRPAQG